MRKLLSPFVAAFTAIMISGYCYMGLRLNLATFGWLLLAVPCLLLWIVPIVYWVLDRKKVSTVDDIIHFSSYTSMGVLSFLMLAVASRDFLILLTSFLFSSPSMFSGDFGANLALVACFIATGVGMQRALAGPKVKEIKIPYRDLDSAFENVKIAQISDLHVGPTIGRKYVESVVQKTVAPSPDFIVLTGDIIDGSVELLREAVQPLGELCKVAPCYFILGNHEYYAGAAPWLEHFKSLGFKTLCNEFDVVNRGSGKIIFGGVTDPAAEKFTPENPPAPEKAYGDIETSSPVFRILLAHNPKLAPAAAAVGFDLQLSGHTHAGQFFP